MSTVAFGEPARSLVAKARSGRAAAADGLKAREISARHARQAFEAARAVVAREQLARMPVGRLKETTEGRIRFGAVEGGGYKTVADILAAGPSRLQSIPGVGQQTASQLFAAARQLEAAVMDTVRVKFDTVGRPKEHAALLAALLAEDHSRQALEPLRDPLASLVADIDAVVDAADRASSRWRMFFSGGDKKRQARDAIGRLEHTMRAATAAGLPQALQHAVQQTQRPAPSAEQLWHDYEQRAVTYNGWLIEVGELEPDTEQAHGYLPAEIAERVMEFPLDTTDLKVALRGYQAFGAKFALVQEKAIIGDEMGLGKTIEALAAMAHLHSAEGATHFLVVSPLSVLINWLHETARHSALKGYRLHGPELRTGLQSWNRWGGVGVTTYEALKHVRLSEGTKLSMMVVDEAHYVKNPAAERTKRVASWVVRCGRTLFLTGTPMENHVGEFRTLVGHLQPDVAKRISIVDGLAGATRFRKEVAAVYLRRNQEDVLDELPPRIDTAEWVDMTGADLDAYRAAVAERNFMGMRRAAFVPPDPAGSAKLARLVEIAEEAADNGRKVVVFSYFRSVIERVSEALGDLVVGAITGSVPGPQRQALVDEFTARGGPAVLICQFEAGGQGLNIQAASVVILTEPQWKPTIEDQAIARCHRMGQVRPVDVHRLLADNSVDLRMLEILEGKRDLFDEYARPSDLKDHSVDAIDVSSVAATKEAAGRSAVEQRIMEMESKRLGLDPAA